MSHLWLTVAYKRLQKAQRLHKSGNGRSIALVQRSSGSGDKPPHLLR